ncbi:MAG: hypothetical protein AAF236_06440 [Verrucomicrobiota bacterium]
MNLFDFFFPEEAQASHLRTLTEQSSAMRARSASDYQSTRVNLTKNRHRIEELEKEVAQLSHTVEALLKELESKQLVDRSKMVKAIADSLVEAEKAEPTTEPKTPQFNFPN